MAFNGYMPQSDELRRVWRALDQDDEGSLRGYITVEEFTSFMRKGMPAPDERSSEEKIRERAPRQGIVLQLTSRLITPHRKRAAAAAATRYLAVPNGSA